MTNSTQALPGQPDDGGGTYTLDNGHPGSYDHEATPHYDYGLMVVTLSCECGKWSAAAAIDPDEDTDDEPNALLAKWEAHVYAATGQTPPDTTPAATAEAELAEENKALRAELDEATDEADRLQRRNEELKVGLLAAEDDRRRMREALRGEQFILWGEIALFEAKVYARHGRRLKEKLHRDPRVGAAWDAFRDALDAAIEADIAAEAGEAR